MTQYKPIINSVVVASLATATAFFCLKLWDEYKMVKKQDEERKHINDATKEKVEETKSTKEEETTEEEPAGSKMDKPFSMDEDSQYKSDDIKIDYDDLDPEDKPIMGNDEPDDSKTSKPNKQIKAKKVEQLRYDPNSKEALEQYHSMLLANFDDHGATYRLIRRMFEVPVQLGTDTDPRATLLSNIQDKRIEFFGRDSVYSKDEMPTLGEIFIYLSTKADYDMGRGQEYWCELWLNLNNIMEPISSYDLKQFGKAVEGDNILETIDDQTYYGIFRLSEDAAEEIPEGIIEQYWDFMTDRLNEENDDEDDGEIENDIDEDDY